LKAVNLVDKKELKKAGVKVGELVEMKVETKV
jgi:hypothetical protein